MNVAIIGLGNMGKNHLRVCLEIPEIEEIYLCDSDQIKGSTIANQHYLQYFKNYKNLLKCNLDLVIIATPTTHHFEIAKFFLENNINILVEKPICTTVEEAEILIDIANDNKVVAMVGHVERFNPVIQKLDDIILESDISIGKSYIGDLVSFSIKRVGLLPQTNDTGIVLDLGIHDYDLCQHIFGTIDYMFSIKDKEESEKEGCSMTLVKLDNGVIGVIENSWHTPYKLREIKVVGTKGTLEADLINMTLKMYNADSCTEFKINKKEPLKAEILHMLECIKKDRTPTVSLEEGLEALMVALCVIESADEKSIIKFG